MRPPQILFLLAAMMFSAGTAAAENPDVLYETFLPGYYIPHAHDIVVDDAGNSYLIGSAYEDHHTLDVMVIKLDPFGNEVWTYYYAGGGHSFATGIALDSSGHPWVTGWTDDSGFPLVNPIDAQFNAREIFLMRFDPADGSVLYSTYIGGDYTDTAEAIVINDQDEIYLGGTSGSTDFPTTPDAWQTEPSAPLYIYQDAVIVKLSPSGDEILYATYFGGFEDDWVTSIALDGQDNILLAGYTNSDDVPLANAIDTAPNDIFISKLSADGGALLFGSYFGGSDFDHPRQMVADAAGNICLTGLTRSVDLPTSPGAYQEEFVGNINGCEVPFGGHYNCEDFFVVRLSTTGEGLFWGTYLGGNTVDEAKAVTCDNLGNVFVAGYTSSDDFPLYDGSFGAAIVVCKLSDDASKLDYTHYVESGSANRGNGITLDNAGDIYFTGTVGVPASVYVSKLRGERGNTAADVQSPSLSRLALAANVPNPFNPKTSIRYTLPAEAEGANVKLGVYDVNGRLVRLLLNDRRSSGEHSIDWFGRDDAGRPVSAGVYFYRLSWGAESLTKSMVLIK